MDEVIINDTKRYPDKVHTQLAARAKLLAALRKMTDEEFLSGKPVTVTCQYRKGITLTYNRVAYRIGGNPRSSRSLAVMDKEITDCINATNR